MQVFLNFKIQAVFGELETCNRENLAKLKNWLDFHGFGFDVYQNYNLPKAIQVREIMIYCPKNVDTDIISNANEILQSLSAPYVEETDNESGVLGEPDVFAHKELKPADNQQELAIYFKAVSNSQTALEFYDNGREPEFELPASKVYGNLMDGERSSKKKKSN